MTRNHWHVNAREQISFPALDRDISVDFAIIGAGFTGLSAALHAATSGMRVAVVDANHVGFGGSGRNVGLVNAGLWLPPDQICGALGQDAGQRLINRLSAAPDDVFDLIKTYDIQCDAHRNGTIHLAHSKDGLADLERRNAQWNARGVKTQVLSCDEVEKRVASPCYHGGLHDPRAGVIQPFDYVRGLARAAASHGVDVFEHTEFRSASHAQDIWHVTTNGGTIRAKYLLNATNAYGPLFGGATVPKTSYVYYFQMVSDRIPDDIAQDLLRNREGCWDTAMIMTSFRMTRDNRLVFGAMGNANGAHGAIHRIWARREMQRIFPQLRGVGLGDYWSGRIAMTPSKIPTILSRDHCSSVFGYSGRGIAPGTALGKDIALHYASDGTYEVSVPISESYEEAFCDVKSAYYETGASMIHAVS